MGMDFLAVSFVVDKRAVEMCSFCLVTSRKPFLISSCCILYLHSNNINSLKFLYLEEKL